MFLGRVQGAPPPITRVKQAGVALLGAAVVATGLPAVAAVDLSLGEDVFNGNCGESLNSVWFSLLILYLMLCLFDAWMMLRFELAISTQKANMFNGISAHAVSRSLERCLRITCSAPGFVTLVPTMQGFPSVQGLPGLSSEVCTGAEMWPCGCHFDFRSSVSGHLSLPLIVPYERNTIKSIPLRCFHRNFIFALKGFR